jgi:hypothetical protein
MNLKAYMQGYLYKQAAEVSQFDAKTAELTKAYDAEVKNITDALSKRPEQLKPLLKQLNDQFQADMKAREADKPNKQTTQALNVKNKIEKLEQLKTPVDMSAETEEYHADNLASSLADEAQGKQKALQEATAPGASAKRLLGTYGKPVGIGAGIGATVGGGASVAYDKANDKPVNLSRAALLALLGGAAGGAGGVMYANSQMK